MSSRAKSARSNHRRTGRESRGGPRVRFLGEDTGTVVSDSSRIKAYAEWGALGSLR